MSSRTNLCGNPSYEIGTSPAVALGSTLTQLAEPKFGTYAMRVQAKGVESAEGFRQDSTTAALSGKHTFSAYVKARDAGSAGPMTVRLEDPTTGLKTETAFTLTTEWQRVSVTHNFNGAGANNRIWIYTGNTRVADFLVDGCLVEQGEEPGTYFDGSFPGYRWDGAEHASSSSTYRPARRKPPLDLDIEVETPDGVFRLPADSRKASDRPRGLSFSTQRGDGFGPGSAQLSREIFKDYSDVGLLDTWRFVGHNGDIAYESRLHSNPRTNDPHQQIDLSLVGWMTYLKSRKIAPLIVDRRFPGWGEPSLARRGVALAAGRTYAHYSASSAFDGIKFDGESGSSIPSLAAAELIYDAGDANAIAKAMYRGTQQNTGSVEAATLYTDDNAELSSVASKTLTLDDTLRTVEPTSAERYAMLRAMASATHTPVAGSPFARTYKYLALYGNHGLTTRSISGEPDGVYLTDIIEYILSSFYPKIEWAGQENTFPVAQADWHDNPAFGYDIARQLNDLVLWEMNVWEKRRLHFEGADLTKYDWQIRTDDPGVSVQFEGDSIEEFANGVEVTYTDFAGTKHVLYPPDHDELRDDSESNPANRHGEDLWTDAEVPWQATEAEALQFGRARLAAFNRPKRPGTYRISGGYIKDGAGHWQQGWKPRSSDTLGILDHPADEPRLIYATDWDQDSLTLVIHTDGLPQTLDAYVARHELALQAGNLR